MNINQESTGLLLLDRELIRQKEFWQKCLAGEPDTVYWPLDYSRPDVYLYREEVVDFELSPHIVAKMLKLTGGSDFLLYTTLLAALSVCLYKYTGISMIPVGSPVREKNDTDMLPGNAVTIVNRVYGDITFQELLAQVRETLLQAYQNQKYPLHKIIEDLELTGIQNKCPLFDILLALKNIHASTPKLKQDMTIIFERKERKITGKVEFNSSLYEKESITAVIKHIETLIGSALANPANKVDKIEMVAESERHRLLREWNNTRQDYNYKKCIHHVFEIQAEKTPGNIAVVMGKEKLTYRELNTKANLLANYLLSLNIRQEELVGILMTRSLDMIISVLAVLKAGGAYVPLNPEHPRDYLAYIIKDTSQRLILYNEQLIDKLPGQKTGINYYKPDWPALQHMSEANPVTDTVGENLAYVIYTSGTTGSPKGVLIRHMNAVNLSYALPGIIFDKYEHPLNISLNAPLTFDVSVKQILQLLNGHTINIIPESTRYAADELINYIAHHKINIFDCTPSHMKLLLAEGLAKRTDLVLKACLIGGEPIDEALWTELISCSNIDFYNGYGPTECTVTTTTTLIESSNKKPHIGTPIGNVRVYILDPSLNLMPIGAVGEIFIGGAGVGRFYLNRPELTVEKFDHDLWDYQEIMQSCNHASIQYNSPSPHCPIPPLPHSPIYRTGDLGSYLPDGRIKFCGRNDGQVKISGNRIELAEIEHTLRQHEAIEDVLVRVGRISDDQRLVGYYVLHPSHQSQKPSVDTLRGFLLKRLPEYMVPNVLIEIPALPLSANGKVDEKQLPDPDHYRPQLKTSYKPPGTEVEKVIADVWSSALQKDNIGAEDNFFDLGGYSLLLYRVRRRIEKSLKLSLTTLELFDNPTIQALARVITDKLSPTDEADVKNDDNKETVKEQQNLSSTERYNRRKSLLKQKKAFSRKRQN
jgi:amino acid adenylation domain-containing protein